MKVSPLMKSRSPLDSLVQKLNGSLALLVLKAFKVKLVLRVILVLRESKVLRAILVIKASKV
jgi:hypothetical protein